ncbi:MAG: DUF3800 domain-containing protein [Opitutales bacterium]|nr:DUF3800 domain-containing protein [Opitutales bacterium]
MENEYIILCDESDQNGSFYSNFFGGVIVGGSAWQRVSTRLLRAKSTAGIQSEVKWSKVSPYDVARYQLLINEFFNIIAEGQVRMRIMFRQNIHEPTNLTLEHKKNEYFILYYQFLKHGFGLRYIPPHPNGVRLRFYLDQLPDQSREKLAQFRGFIAAIGANSQIRKAGLSIRESDVTEVDSKQHILLQCADVVLGAMSFRLNEKHKAIPYGEKHRGKRTVAKEQLYKFIRREICRITGKQYFNVGISTALSEYPAGYWKDPYLHWNFRPKHHRVETAKGKQAQQKRPI